MPKQNKSVFSVIVPAYNVENYIEECINSVLEQDFKDFELILVDDGSTDRTSEICKGYTRTSKVRYVYQENAGLSSARNTGVRHAIGEYLIFLDGDDYLLPEALKTIQDGLEPGLDLLRYQAEEVFEDGKTVEYKEAGFDKMSGVVAFRRLAHYHYTENAWLYAYRREFFIENKFEYAKGCIAEDFGLTPLIIAQAKTAKAIPEICYAYRQREGSIMHNPEKIARRTQDIERQLEIILPRIAEISGSEAILHYLVVSFLTEAAKRSQPHFLQIYQKAKNSGMLEYVHPASLKALPRSLLLKYFPKVFYRVYR